MQVFGFCTILGLFSFDYETLRRNGFSLADLLAVHDTPVLSGFASGDGESRRVSFVFGKGEVLDLVKFFSNHVLPQMPK